MATQSFYPNIGTLVTLNDFPEELQFLEIGLQNALNKIYYKELQYVKSSDGSYPTANNFQAVEGPGGDYLSNEIFYRVAFLRDSDSNNSDKMTGHIDVGYLKDPSTILGYRNVTVSTDRDDMLDKIKESIINAINGL